HPEEGDKGEDRQHSKDRLHALDSFFRMLGPGAVEKAVSAAAITPGAGNDRQERVWVLSRRWNLYVLMSTEPENQGRDPHQNAGNSKCDRRSKEPKRLRDQHRSEERAQIDAPVERGEHLGDEVLGLGGELVSHERRDTGLDASGAKRDQ